MFDNPLLLYFCWRDAERESKENPDDGGGNNYGGCLLLFAVVFICCLFKAAFEVGGYAILFAFLILIAFLQGFFEQKK